MPRFVLVMSLLGAAPLFAQSTATLTGQVTDQSGEAMPRVQVIATAVESAVEHKTTTNESGYYSLGQPVTGPMPYVYLATFSQYPVGSREYILGQASNGQGFLLTEGANGNRTIQFALKVFF